MPAWAWHRRFIGILEGTGDAISPGLAMQNFARAIRTSGLVLTLNRAMGHYVAPTIFGIAPVYLAAALANRIVFDVARSYLCILRKYHR